MVRVGINGFGRIGRNVLRAMATRKDLQVVGINDLGDAATMAHLLRRDSVLGTYKGTVEVAGKDALIVDGRRIPFCSERDPARLPWKNLEVDVALESTGVFTTREACAKHLEAGAKRVILSAPPKDALDATIVMGVNHKTLKPEHRLISNASCTTNCMAPLVKVLHDNFGVKNGLLTTVHAYTNDQQILDLPHKDLRRARAAALNIIPTTTGAARAVGKVIPELNGKLDGLALRVPVPCGSIVDFTATLNRSVTREEVNAAVSAAAEGSFKGIIEYSEEPLVSSDILGNPHSSIFDAESTYVLDGTLVKVVAWYDNEWGYSCRCCDLMSYLAGL